MFQVSFSFSLIFAGSPTKSPKKFSTATINGGGNGKNGGSRLILNHQQNNKKETSFKNVPAVKSIFLSDEDEEETEDDDYEDETDVFPGDH